MQAELQLQLQQQLNQAQELKSYEMKVISLDLEEHTEGVYYGHSTLEYAGQHYPITLLVLITDQQEYIVNIPYEDFGFLDDIAIEKYRAQLDREFQLLVGEFDINTPVNQVNTIESSIKTP